MMEQPNLGATKKLHTGDLAFFSIFYRRQKAGNGGGGDDNRVNCSILMHKVKIIRGAAEEAELPDFVCGGTEAFVRARANEFLTLCSEKPRRRSYRDFVPCMRCWPG
jgi:hypothetical protein